MSAREMATLTPGLREQYRVRVRLAIVEGRDVSHRERVKLDATILPDDSWTCDGWLGLHKRAQRPGWDGLTRCRTVNVGTADACAFCGQLRGGGSLEP